MTDNPIVRFERTPDRDTKEKIGSSEYPIIAWTNIKSGAVIYTEPEHDPNQAKWFDKLFLLFTDQAEYYAVCANCYATYRRMQWSGTTRSSGWRQHSQEYLSMRMTESAWCEFCDPIFGNGGWSLK